MKISISGNKINYKAISRMTGEINWLVMMIDGKKTCLFPNKRTGEFMKISQFPEEYDTDYTDLIDIR